MSDKKEVNYSPVLKGRVAWVFEDDFDVDLIIGPENIANYDPSLLKNVFMKNYEDNFFQQVSKGDFFIGGKNFGYGHPHKPAMISARLAGIVAVIAESFSPAFWRAETHSGMLLITSPGISKVVNQWDTLEVHWKKGIIKVLDTGKVIDSFIPNDRVIQIIEAGGSYPLLLEQYGK
jgi:3-isopropylmalate/(R)-2-methylmalate dehydratase small subunit